MDKLSVLLVDDHQLFREGLKLILERLPNLGRIYEAADGMELIEFLNNGGRADIVFIDIEMPVLNGIEATRQALKSYPDLNIIALSMYGDEEYYTQMIEAGAKGFVLKNSGIAEIEAAITNVAEGKNFFSQEILTGILKGISKRNLPPRTNELSEREQEVLYQICKGLSNQEIADVLHISKRTVDKHRENILLKSGSRNTAGLVMFAIKNGIIEV
jgi:DNA-binding NarL/FixJ family response regulator